MDKTIAKILLIISLLYFTWHLGRVYEAKVAREVIKQASENWVYTEYFIPEWDKHYAGEIAVGNCMPNEKAENLLEYAGLDY